MLAAALVSPVSAMNGVNLTVGNFTISAATPYIITFIPGVNQPAGANAIVVTFATGMLVGNPAVTIQASGNGTTAIPLTTITADTTIAGQVATINTGGPVPIGTIVSGANVTLTFSNITNPATIGNYSVSVSTAAEPTAVTSNVITTTSANATGLPGIIQVFNSAGALVTSSNDLAAALAAVQSQTLTGAVIKLPAGTYRSAYPANTTVACTIQGIDSNAANVILQSTGAWALTGATVTIDSVTIDAAVGGLLSVGGATTTAAIVNKSYLKGGVITLAGSGANASATVSNDTFTVATGAAGLIVKTPAIITGSVFNVDGTGIGVNAQANVLVSNSTFTGTSGAGLGITLNGGNASVISTSTFTGLTTALTVSNAGAGVSFNGNTVTSCGVLSTHDAIVVTATSGTYLFNNSISKSLNNFINVSGNDNLVVLMLNSFSGNAKNAVDSAGGVLNCTRNYWGGTNSNPTSTANVSYASALGAAPSASVFVTGASGLTLAAANNVGVNITASAGMITLGAAALTANPVSAALPSTVTAINYFDVFGFGTASASATIDFHGTDAAPVTSGSTVYFYNSASGAWVQASDCTVSTANGFVEVSIAPGAGATANTAPSPAQFEGTPFALVNVPSDTTTTATVTTATTTATTTAVTTAATTAVVTTATTTAKTTTSTTITTTATHTPGQGKPVIPSGLLYGVIAISLILVVVIVIVIVRASSV
jgi:hypothetical protein